MFRENAPFQGTQCTINDPHSNAVVDLDGDCLAGLVSGCFVTTNLYSCYLSDLFLTCDDGKGGKKYQVWVNKKEEGFSLSQEGQLPFGTQAISFADIGLFFYIPKTVLS